MTIKNYSKQAILKSTIICLSAALFSACASTPETTEVAATPPPPPAAPVAPVQPNQTDVVPVAPVAPVIAQPTLPVAPGPVPGSVDDFINQAGDRIFFGYDQYSLTAQARDVLRNQALWLNNYPSITAVIGGNCDERGTREYNLALGARRADAVKDFLVSQGVDPSRLTTVSYGKERPIDGRSNEQAWALNRNANTAIVTINS